MARLGAVAKCAPPLRSQSEQAELWQQLGDVTTIGSDHSPSPWSMKEERNFFRVWGGISGCQHLLPLLIDARERISLPEIARLTSENVAERFRISTKGGLKIGKAADLTLVDPGEEETIRTEALQYRHRPPLISGAGCEAELSAQFCGDKQSSTMVTSARAQPADWLGRN